jgi:hypothetical protein
LGLKCLLHHLRRTDVNPTAQKQGRPRHRVVHRADVTPSVAQTDRQPPRRERLPRGGTGATALARRPHPTPLAPPHRHANGRGRQHLNLESLNAQKCRSPNLRLACALANTCAVDVQPALPT